MGKTIVKTAEKTEKLEKMLQKDKYTSEDMIDLIMIEKEFVPVDIPMERVEANKVPEAAQHEQLHVIRNIQTAKQKAQALSETSTENTHNPNLKAVVMHVDGEPTAPPKAKTQDNDEHEHEHGHEH